MQIVQEVSDELQAEILSLAAETSIANAGSVALSIVAGASRAYRKVNADLKSPMEIARALGDAVRPITA